MRFFAFLGLIVAGCAPLPPDPPAGNLILHYVRSNQDGSEPEHVVQFRPNRTGIAVYKWVEKCTTAAYVTAEMDMAVREARRYVAGKVGPDGTQLRFGTLSLDPAVPALDLSMAGDQPLQRRHPLRSRPYLLFDFDFAELNAYLQEAGPRGEFAFEMPVIWPSDPKLFRDLGRLTATYEREEYHLGRRTARFVLRLDGPAPSRGILWIDARQGFIVEALLGLPNHEEYRDFRLRLERVERGGQQAWDSLIRGHYRGCATGN